MELITDCSLNHLVHFEQYRLGIVILICSPTFRLIITRKAHDKTLELFMEATCPKYC
jgi:hypothetical protein